MRMHAFSLHSDMLIVMDAGEQDQHATENNYIYRDNSGPLPNIFR